MKKEKNLMYMSGNKKHAVKVRDKTVDLRETKALYERLMVLARSNRDIGQKQAVGTYEFTLTPRSLFAPDGSVLPCSDKSKLIHALENMVATDTDHAERISMPTTRSFTAVANQEIPYHYVATSASVLTMWHSGCAQIVCN